MHQPFSGWAKTLLETQNYPDLREYPGGPPKRPYDVTAQTLPLLMNIRAVTVNEPFAVEAKPEPMALVIQSRVRSSGGVRVAMYKNFMPSMDEGWTRWVFDQYKFEFKSLLRDEVRAGGLATKFDAIIIPDQSVAALVNGLPGKAGEGRGEGRDEETGGGYPAEYAGGLGDAGVKALREFVE